MRRARRLDLRVTLLAAASILSGSSPWAHPEPARAAQPAGPCQDALFARAAPQVDPACQLEPGAGVTADVVAAGFQETVVWSGLTNPTAVRFAADGRVFVAEKSGVIKIFDNLADATPTSFTGLTTKVHNFWDRGLLGLALDPSLTGGTGTGSFVYVLYAYDHILGSTAAAPRWGDACPLPPGATTDGCVVSGRLSRFPVNGSSIVNSEQVLIEDWCQQYPSHSAGSLVFGPDGALYVSSGDGASFTTLDYGQRGGTTSPVVTERNPCGDPPGGTMSPPDAQGGALRSQDIRGVSPSVAYRDVVLGDSPISYWRLGEAAGTTAVDAVGANNGTYVGSPTLGTAGAIAGDSNPAVTLNGTSQYVLASSAPFRFAGTQPFSAEVWFRHTADDTYRRILGAENAIGQGWHVYSQSGAWGVVRNGTGGAAEVTNGTPAGSGWVHAVATYDGTTLRLYQNGVEIPLPVGSAQGLPADSSFFIGRYGGAPVSMFNGTLDEVAVYGRALTAQEVAEHFAAASGAGGAADPVSLDGAILRVDPTTGDATPGNPFAADPDPNARRIIAYGLRNPFRITFKPGTNELWFGDVGWDTWEEVNRIPDATDAAAENFGWPCYEGSGRQSGYDGANLALCETLYANGGTTAPFFTYNHAAKVVATETCPTGSSSVTGIAFYPESGGSFPAGYAGGLFVADHSRNCIWFMPKGANGQPNPAAVTPFIEGAGNPVDLVIGPGGDLFYPDFEGGAIRRVSPTGGNVPPTAVIQATPGSGPAPLTVQFSGTGSSDPEGSQLAYAWDLDGDGAFDDATTATTQFTYQQPGNVTVGLRVTDTGNASGTTTRVISVANSPPVPVIAEPIADTTWRVGDAIAFSGSASDPQDGALPASALTWTLVLQHCPSNCHAHQIQTWTGVDAGTFAAPDHEYPSYLELTLTARDSLGTTTSVTRRLDPRTVVLTFQSSPAGLALAVNGSSSTTSFARTVIAGSSNAVTATSPQSLNGSTWTFASWSDGGAGSHQIVAPATNTTYTASYTTTTFAIPASADAQVRSHWPTTNYGSATLLRVRLNQSRVYLRFVVTGLSGAATSARIRLWVTDGSNGGGSIFRVASNTWTESGLTWNNMPASTGAALSTVGSAATGTWVEFDVGSAITGNGTYSFLISGGLNNAVDYASRETSNDPIIVITP